MSQKRAKANRVSCNDMLDHLLTVLVEGQGDKIPVQYHDRLKAEMRDTIEQEVLDRREGE